MTTTILAQTDFGAAKAVATYWLDVLTDNEFKDDLTMNGDRVLRAVPALSEALEAEDTPEATQDAFMFSMGFNGGVDAGFALALEVIANPFAVDTQRLRHALTQATAVMPRYIRSQRDSRSR